MKFDEDGSEFPVKIRCLCCRLPIATGVRVLAVLTGVVSIVGIGVMTQLVPLSQMPRSRANGGAFTLSDWYWVPSGLLSLIGAMCGFFGSYKDLKCNQNASMLTVYLITIVLNMAHALGVLVYLIVATYQKSKKLCPITKNAGRILMFDCFEPDIDNSSYGLLFGVMGGLILVEILMVWMVRIVYKFTKRFKAMESHINSEDIHS
eukprot:805660_1